MTLLPYTEEAEWLRFVPCWLHANLKMAARQWNKRQHNRKYLANSATQEISCEFGYLSATCRSARARFLSPIDGANHNARNCSPFTMSYSRRPASAAKPRSVPTCCGSLDSS